MCHYPNIKNPDKERYKENWIFINRFFLKKSEAMKGVNERNISFNLKISFTEYKMCFFISGWTSYFSDFIKFYFEFLTKRKIL